MQHDLSLEGDSESRDFQAFYICEYQATAEHYEDLGIAVTAAVVADTGELAGWAGLSIPTFLARDQRPRSRPRNELKSPES